MSRRRRLDAELVRRGLVISRNQAAAVVASGRVLVGGQPVDKPARLVSPDEPIVLTESEAGEPDYASRGGHKLAGALRVFTAADPPLLVTGRRCLDAGASTGGFTDVLLRAGAREVVAVDVGYGQLAWRLRTDPRVRVLDRVNARALAAHQIGGPAQLTVADLSFISLRLVLPALRACTEPDGDLVLLVKPQFEVGREGVGAGGVVRDPALRAQAVRAVANAAAELGLGVRGALASPLPGPAGNVEFFLWLTAGAPPLDEDALAEAVATLEQPSTGPGATATAASGTMNTMDTTTAGSGPAETSSGAGTPQ